MCHRAHLLVSLDSISLQDEAPVSAVCKDEVPVSAVCSFGAERRARYVVTRVFFGWMRNFLIMLVV